MSNIDYIFITTLLNVEVELPATISENIELIHLEGDILSLIKKHIPAYFGLSRAAFINPYETDYVLDSDGELSKTRKLPESKHKYYAIRKVNARDRYPIDYAFMLLRSEIELGFAIIKGQGTIGISSTNNLGIHNYYMSRSIAQTERTITLNELEELGNYFKLVSGDIKSSTQRALELLMLTRTLESSSYLRILVLFIAIETILTHRPKNTDNRDSLTHQISSKMILAKRMFSRILNTAEYFNSMNESVLWKKLYDLRSKIAHGDTINFRTGSLNTLKDQSNVWEYLFEATKLLIVLALREPVLLSDLKEC